MQNISCYHDRRDAGRKLAAALQGRKIANPLVLGIPRGGVPVAVEIAEVMRGDLDIVVARKIGAPMTPELAVGAVTADGVCIINDEVVQMLGLTAQWLKAATAYTVAQARDRDARLRGRAPAHSVAGREVILVDDGLATGATMRAAVQSVRRRNAKHILIAVPVGSRDAVQTLAEEADQVLCLQCPSDFRAVGNHYQDFLPTGDTEVTQLLETFALNADASARAARP